MGCAPLEMTPKCLKTLASNKERSFDDSNKNIRHFSKLTKREVNYFADALNDPNAMKNPNLPENINNQSIQIVPSRTESRINGKRKYTSFFNCVIVIEWIL